MIKKTVTQEIKRLVRLSSQTYKLFGLHFFIKEVFRYLKHGAIPVYNSNLNDYNNNDYLTSYTGNQINNILSGFHHNPLISIVTPVYNVKPEYLDKCIRSVIAQHYKNWELCLYDDCSAKEETKQCLEKWSKTDTRIKFKRGNENLHISLASNEAIAMAEGEYIGFLDHDDELLPITLLEVVKAINKNPGVGLIYTDEDFISPKGDLFNPHFKSDFNKALILSHNYITHFMVVERNLGKQAGWFRKGYEGSQDHDLILRIMDYTDRIIHLPKILYHWRQSSDSTSLNYKGKSYADMATRKALLDYAQRNGFKAEILDGPGNGIYRMKREIITDRKVSIIIPFKDQVPFLKECVSSVLEKTTYTNFELLLVSNNSKEKTTFDYLESIKKTDTRIKVLEHNVPFNFSGINNWAVEQTEGDYILLLNNDIKVINPDWLEAMVEHIQQENVGIVGAKLLYADNTIQHAGVIIGICGVAGHSHKFFHDSSTGYFYRTSVIQNLSAVTGACLLTKKELWKKAGGLDETNLKIAFNDIDYCLTIRSMGYDVVYTPYARLYHYESKTRGPEDTPEKQQRFANECRHMVKKWGTDHLPDPFYNINLTLNSENFDLKDFNNSDKSHRILVIDNIGEVHLSDNLVPLILGNQSDYLLIEGWINDPGNRKSVEAPQLIINDKLHQIEAGVKRVDVALSTNDNRLIHAGFKCYIPINAINNGENRVGLKFFDMNGIGRETNYYSFKYIDLTLLDPNNHAFQLTSTIYRNYLNVNKELLKCTVEKNDYHRETIELRNSISWKVTAPLRWLGLFIKWLIRLPWIIIFVLKNKIPLRHGIFNMTPAANGNITQLTPDQKYQLLLKRNQPDWKLKSQIKNECSTFRNKPLISIIVPVYNVNQRWLKRCIESVINQYYQNWELCLYDDASTNKGTLKCLKSYEDSDKRIKIQYGFVNRNISLATNEAIKLATGEYISFLDNDDELLPITLYEVIKAINANPDVDFIYTDEDNISPKGDYFNPHFKSDFNKELILSHNYITHFVTVKRELGESVGWLREGYEGSQDHDLILRMIEKTNRIIHIPKILYHWRQTASSTSLNYNSKSYAQNATRKALSDYAHRNGFKAAIVEGPGLGVYRMKREVDNDKLVSIIVPFKDQCDLLMECVTSLLEKTSYKNVELLLVSNNSKENRTFEFLEKVKKTDKRIRVLEHNMPFNFSEINNWAVEQSMGDYILLLNNDIKVIDEDWLEAMVEHIQQENTGVVGAKLLYPDNTLQHAGVIIGILGVAGHSHKYMNDKNVGYFYRAAVAQNMSAVTGACLLTKKEVWKKAGGLDETNFKIAFNDIDYCLKVRSLGYDIVYTPYARLYHYESKSRGTENTPEKQKRFAVECNKMIEKWGTNKIPDPFYNVNLTLISEDFSLKVE